MALGSRVCPQCGALNGAAEPDCIRCGRPFPGPLTRSARGLLGNISSQDLPVTKLLAGLCIGVYALGMALEGGTGGALLGGLNNLTLLRFGALFGPFVRDEPWRLVSAMFVHASLLHIGMNMLALVSLGRTLEQHFHSARFLLLYLVSGTLGFAASLWWGGNLAAEGFGRARPLVEQVPTFTLGASSAIFGLLGAQVGLLLVRKNPGWQQVFFSNLILAVALGVLSSRIDHAAHIGGFVAGFVLGALLELEPQPRRRDGVMAVLAAAALLVALASIVLSVQSPNWKLMKRIQEADSSGLDSG